MDGIGTGLVHGLAGGDVIRDLFVGEGEKADCGDFGGDFDAFGGDDGNAGDDAMGATGEQTQDAGCFGGAIGLAEDVAVECDGGIGAEDHRRWGRVIDGELVEDGLCFVAGETSDVGDGVFIGEGIFRDVSGMDFEKEAGLGKEFAAARRG